MSTTYKQRQDIKHPDRYCAVYKEMEKRGYMPVKEVSARFNNREIQHVLANFDSLGLFVYQDRISVDGARYGREVGCAVVKPLNELFAQWAEERKTINGQIDYVSSSQPYRSRGRG